ncbi:enoyl-CoA hydratase [bacterium]|nr:MAG: enoyl-CoA hydratase [bacterium]RKZ16012.1 MAG: enoyl-CoA hydratase [bacterium]
MELANLQYELSDSIATVTVNRPKALNALNRATLDELESVIAQAAADDSVRVLIFTGAGEKAFVAGADIKELSALSPLEAARHAAMGQAIFGRLEAMGKPSIAAINGFALGGGLELAMACTLRIAADTARMGLPEITLGLIPGFAGTQRLPRLIGQGRALQLVLTGEMIKADRAEAMGLVNEVVDAASLMDRARELAGKLTGFSAATLGLAEATVREGAEMAFDQACALEAARFGVAFATNDAAEGMGAFMEKRKAEFKGL